MENTQIHLNFVFYNDDDDNDETYNKLEKHRCGCVAKKFTS